jgi:hypothetical protein
MNLSSTRLAFAQGGHRDSRADVFACMRFLGAGIQSEQRLPSLSRTHRPRLRLCARLKGSGPHPRGLAVLAGLGVELGDCQDRVAVPAQAPYYLVLAAEHGAALHRAHNNLQLFLGFELQEPRRPPSARPQHGGGLPL